MCWPLPRATPVHKTHDSLEWQTGKSNVQNKKGGCWGTHRVRPLQDVSGDFKIIRWCRTENSRQGARTSMKILRTPWQPNSAHFSARGLHVRSCPPTVWGHFCRPNRGPKMVPKMGPKNGPMNPCCRQLISWAGTVFRPCLQ